MLPVNPTENVRERAGLFVTTHWSVILAAKGDESEVADEALTKLCRMYWYPLYAFVRRRGHSPHDAEDLTQEFFCRLLHKDYLRVVDYRKGRFRTFLLTAIENFLRYEWRRAHAQKRGGGFSFLSLDDPGAEQRYCQEPVSRESPEKVYERNCALALLEQALHRLRAEFEAQGKGDRFERLKGFLTADEAQAPYAELASQLDASEAALKMTVSRMRKRYGEILRETVRQTVASAEQAEDELRSLFAALEE